MCEIILIKGIIFMVILSWINLTHLVFISVLLISLHLYLYILILSLILHVYIYLLTYIILRDIPSSSHLLT
jgi:hypothetical protein